MSCRRAMKIDVWLCSYQLTRGSPQRSRISAMPSALATRSWRPAWIRMRSAGTWGGRPRSMTAKAASISCGVTPLS